MCTATYLPFRSDGFILTHSRDEHTTRQPAVLPRIHDQGGQPLLYPEDPYSGGTWIVGGLQASVCLLNGAFTAHVSTPPYKHSRGLVPLHVFDYRSVRDFCRRYNPAGIEPFTLILAEAEALTEFRWDGQSKHVTFLNPHRPYIWSSATLYSPQNMRRREQWFRNWLSNIGETRVEAIRHFHLNAGKGDPENALLMNRNNKLMTLSLTSLVRLPGNHRMLYTDLLQDQSVSLVFNQHHYAIQ
ncbi:NRDE family protein [Arsenicibacter rosenii]|uniref:NRDE family protein n=1 Tax=Arsenicibacter rosenii TaxID=1750698 RepID=A0A1S2VFK2_9BACT|nr:NRDE family protein [Arsenicibacter rosenii]OIN57503.1 hypothetical protein BLX24_19960 [Arsenicibacter rosenii]